MHSPIENSFNRVNQGHPAPFSKEDQEAISNTTHLRNSPIENSFNIISKGHPLSFSNEGQTIIDHTTRLYEALYKNQFAFPNTPSSQQDTDIVVKFIDQDDQAWIDHCMAFHIDPGCILGTLSLAQGPSATFWQESHIHIKRATESNVALLSRQPAEAGIDVAFLPRQFATELAFCYCLTSLARTKDTQRAKKLIDNSDFYIAHLLETKGRVLSDLASSRLAPSSASKPLLFTF